MRAAALLLVLGVVLAGCLRNVNPQDEDGDNLPDSFETSNHTVCWQTLTGQSCRSWVSNPSLADSDHDGVRDDEEVRLGTDPSEPDTDGDGLLDGRDLPDAQADAVRSRLVAQNIVFLNGFWLGEASQCGGQGSNPLKQDSDLITTDGISDGDEVRGWNITVAGQVRRVSSDPCSADSDNDGLRDGAEKEAGSDPSVADTDGDGAKDGVDVDPLYNLGVKLTVQRIALKGARSATGGSLRLDFQTAATTSNRNVNVPAGGTATPNVVFNGDVDDSSDKAQVLLGVKDASTGVALDFGGKPVAIQHDLSKATVSQTYEGTDGSVTVVLETARS